MNYLHKRHQLSSVLQRTKQKPFSMKNTTDQLHVGINKEKYARAMPSQFSILTLQWHSKDTNKLTSTLGIRLGFFVNPIFLSYYMPVICT